MSGLVREIVDEIDDRHVEQLADALGAHGASIRDAIDIGVPVLVAGINHHLDDDPDGAEEVHRLVTDGAVHDLDEYFAGPDPTPGALMIPLLLGPRAATIRDGLAHRLDLPDGATAKLLALLAPVVLSVLGRGEPTIGTMTRRLVSARGELAAGPHATALTSLGIDLAAGHDIDLGSAPVDDRGADEAGGFWADERAVPVVERRPPGDESARRRMLGWLLPALLLVPAALTAYLLVRDDGTGAASTAASSSIGSGNVLDVARATGQAKGFLELVAAAGLEDQLRNGTGYTLLVPSDTALAQLPAGTVDALKANPSQASAFVLQHVLAQTVTAANVNDPAQSLQTLGATTVTAARPGGVMTFNSVPAVLQDQLASNGAVQVLSGVLLASASTATTGSSSASTATTPSSSVDPTVLPPANGEPTLVDIVFASGKATIPRAAKAKLDALAAAIVAQGVRIEIAGYTDDVGDADANLALSLKRSRAVRNYLITKGAPPRSIVARGFGEEDPVASNDTDEGRAANRRIEMRRLT